MDSDQRAMRHMKFPERGTLRVTRIHDGHSRSKINGEVRRVDGSVYTAHTSLSVTTPEHRAALAPGARLSVWIDPSDPTRVEIDTYRRF